MSNQLQETMVDSRRTFAIISHPDAGKTTLTEKMLLLGGMIRSAGTVKGKNQASLLHLTGWKSKTTWNFGYIKCYAV